MYDTFWEINSHLSVLLSGYIRFWLGLSVSSSHLHIRFFSFCLKSLHIFPKMEWIKYWNFNKHSLLPLSGPGRELRDSNVQTYQLPIRNLLFYDVQTFWLLLFILKTCSDQILAKLIDQGYYRSSFLQKRTKSKKESSAWKLLKLTCQFWAWKNNLGHKAHFFLS